MEDIGLIKDIDFNVSSIVEFSNLRSFELIRYVFHVTLKNFGLEFIPIFLLLCLFDPVVAHPPEEVQRHVHQQEDLNRMFALLCR